MKPARFQSQAGFTLVELMVGATLSAAIMAAVLSSYIYLGRGLARLANQQTLDTEARRTLAYFTQDVQSSSGLTDTANLSDSRLSLVVPSVTGTNTVTYYYNNTASDAAVTVNGISVTMTANALTRCVYNGSTVTTVLLLRNVTSSGLTLKYYDNAGNPYTSYVNYLPGIKQVSLQFTTQLGTAANNTQTLAYSSSTGRLILRNGTFLQ
jgi:prepilin-type N-terminal cleavage/methylation domain-containing protein